VDLQPNDYKPGVYMPMYRYLPEKQIKAIAAYIYSLK
jgi:mono/diheme cytochrome c family protein